MRVLFIIRSTSFFDHQEPIVEQLAARGHQIKLLFRREQSSAGRDYTIRQSPDGSELVAVSPDPTSESEESQTLLINTHGSELGHAPPRNDRWVKVLQPLREIRSYAAYLRRDDSSVFLTQQERLVPRPVRYACRRSPLARAIVKSRFAEFSMRMAEATVPSSRVIKDVIKAENPDVIAVAPINFQSRKDDFSDEIEWIKAANALSIPSVAPVYSWDNLTARGRFQVSPSVVLAWNSIQRGLLEKDHYVPADQIVVTGSPYFEKWLDASSTRISRDAFLNAVGIDPKMPYVLYLGSSGKVTGNETWLVKELADAFRAHQNAGVQGTRILVRPHPSNASHFADFVDDLVTVWPKQGELSDSQDAVANFYNSAVHSVATLGVNTSGMVDALAMDVPGIALTPQRVKRSSEGTAHFRDLLHWDACEFISSVDECAESINQLILGNDTKSDNRARLRSEFLWPRGFSTKPSALMAEAIELAGGGLSGAEIEEQLVGDG